LNMRFSREEMATFIVLACALLAIGALYMLTGPTGQYTPASADGDHVTVSGVLLSKKSTRAGGHMVLGVKTDSDILSVFVPVSSDAILMAKSTMPGKEITVTGTVKTYKNEKEIIADSIKEK